jgi:uncharacterized protein (UPF0371 family)
MFGFRKEYEQYLEASDDIIKQKCEEIQAFLWRDTAETGTRREELSKKKKLTPEEKKEYADLLLILKSKNEMFIAINQRDLNRVIELDDELDALLEA